MSAGLGDKPAPDDLTQLQGTLTQALKLRPGGQWGEPAAMTQALLAVRRAFNRPDVNLSSRNVARTLLAFRLSHNFSTFIELRAACHGLARQAPWGGRRLIEEDALFAKLLREVDALSAEPRHARRFRKCYQGLLASMLLYPVHNRDATPMGRQHWQQLRTFLRQRLPRINQPAPLPLWVEILQAHPELLVDGDSWVLAERLAAHFAALPEEERQRVLHGLAVPKEGWLLAALNQAVAPAPVERPSGPLSVADIPRLDSRQRYGKK